MRIKHPSNLAIAVNDTSALPRQEPFTRVKLVRDPAGGLRLSTESGQILENVFVKQYERVHGSVTRVNIEVIYISPNEHGKNW